MISESVDQALKDFVAWDRVNNPADIGYPHSTATEKLRGGGIGCAGLSDDEAALIDYALCRLADVLPDHYRVLWKMYFRGQTARQLANRRGWGNRDTINRMAGEARSFVRGIIFGAEFHGAPNLQNVAGPGGHGRAM